ncbi:MAG: B-box zinc finger protein [Myxococcaceae bacterium]
MNPPQPARCTHHPRELAGWYCQGCEASLCPDCVAGSTMGTVELVSCCRCGGQAQELQAHRATTPFSTRVLSAWRYPFSRNGLIGVVGLGGVLWLLGNLFFIPLVWITYVGIFWASMFAAIRQSAQGQDDIDAPDFSDLWSGLIAPAAAGILGTAVLWLPGLLYWAYVRHPDGILRDPGLWVLVVAGAVYAPMALAAAATGSGLGRMLNPLAIAAYIGRLGADYFIAVGAIVVLGAAAVVFGILSGLVSALPVPIVAGWVSSCLRLLAPLMMARVLGLLLYTRGDALGFGRVQDFQVPVLPGVAPRGLPAPRAGQEQGSEGDAGRRWAPIELESPPEEVPAAAAPSKRAPVELDPGELPPLPAGDELSGEAELPDAIGAICAAVAANELPRAAGLYAKAGVPEASLSAEVHLAVGQSAATAGDYALAVRALKAAARDPADPLAPKALVVLARVYGEKLGEPDAAARLYQHVLKSYPGTPAAKFAEGRLSPGV